MKFRSLQHPILYTHRHRIIVLYQETLILLSNNTSALPSLPTHKSDHLQITSQHLRLQPRKKKNPSPPPKFPKPTEKCSLFRVSSRQRAVTNCLEVTSTSVQGSRARGLTAISANWIIGLRDHWTIACSLSLC